MLYIYEDISLQKLVVVYLKLFEIFACVDPHGFRHCHSLVFLSFYLG